MTSPEIPESSKSAPELKSCLRRALATVPIVRRREALATLRSSKDSLPPTFITLLLTRLPTDRASLSHALTILSSALASQGTTAAISKKLPSITTSIQKSPLPTREALALLRASCVLCEDASLRTASLKLLVAALTAIEASPAPQSGSHRRARDAALRAAYGAAAKPMQKYGTELVSSLMSAAARFVASPSEAVAALGLLSTAADILTEEQRHAALVAAATACIKGRPPVAENVVLACPALFSNADGDVVVGKMMPVIERALLREPEIALPASAVVLAALSVDISSVAKKALFPPVVQAVKSSDERTRRSGVQLAGIIGSCVKDQSALVEGMKSLFDFLKSARYAYQKVAAVEAISRLACAVPKRDANMTHFPGLEEGLSGVRTWFTAKKESNEEARTAGFRALVDLASCTLSCGDVARERPTVKACGELLSKVLCGTSEADRSALLAALIGDSTKPSLPLAFFSDEVLNAVQQVILRSSKPKQEACLRAFALLASWSEEDSNCDSIEPGSKLWKLVGEPASSPLALDNSSLPVSDVHCALRCCKWMVEKSHVGSAFALATVFALCLDVRPEVSSAAIEQVRTFRSDGTDEVAQKMFQVLWDTQFGGDAGKKSVAKSYSFDDGMVAAEKLGRTVLAAVLPCPSGPISPLVALAANHPRLLPTPEPGRAVSRSRYWKIIERVLARANNIDKVDGDWIEQCLDVILGDRGLKSSCEQDALAAVNALGALANARNTYATEVLRIAVHRIRPLAVGAPQLAPEAHEALRLVKEADSLAANQMSTVQRGTGVSRSSKKSVSSSNPRLNQQRQAEIDRARAAAASAAAAADKANAARPLAAEAAQAFLFSKRALFAILRLALVSPRAVYDLTATMLSLIIPAAKLEELENPCRQALSALTLTSSERLKDLREDIAVTLYGLERGYDVKSNVSRIVYGLKDRVPPALPAEGFSLVAPVVQAALSRDPEAEDKSTMSGKRSATKRRDTIAVVKAAAQVLLEHCKPEAIDSAIAAAAARAGSWAVKVLEREDGAFAAAADALALLTGTALTPGNDQLSQVLTGVASGKSSVRDAALAALARLPQLSTATIECPRDAVLGRALWLARFDPDEANAELANELWQNYKHPLHVPEDVPSMLPLLAHKESDIRMMAAKAISTALSGKQHEATRNVCVPQMFTMYLKKLPSASDEELSQARKGIGKRGKDRPINAADGDPCDDGWYAREGVALAVENMAMANALKPKDITVCFAFLSGRGLGDRNDKVRAGMSRAAIAVVQAAGTLGPTILLPMIEKQLNVDIESTASKEDVLHADRTRENLVMCLGSVAGFLPPEDPRVRKIAEQVIRSAMETPSEMVQNAAARCLAPLARICFLNKGDIEVTDSLLKTVWSEDDGYGARRGAAYALAGISKGLGLKYMGRSKIMSRVEIGLSDKSPRMRQGAFLIIETCAILMGRLFEPYTVAALPFLLSCMGDSVVEVRNSCWAATQAAMSEITSQGVKMILPTLLNGLKDRQWRTKAGSAEVLGAMAFCAPRQLAQCLPQVVPKLADALADAHPRVVTSAESAINRIAAVVRSPEVRKLSPFLLSALRDPAGKTRGAIDAMLGSEFVHAIDAASLALLIPPLHRGLRDRSSELKKRSAAIVGSMCNNVANQFDVVPYLDLLLPDLRVTLLDAIPDVRSTSARALGALAVSLGEQGLPDIVPWLINALLGGVNPNTSNSNERGKVGSTVVSSSAERSGAAMGLAEVCASMSDKRLEDVLNRVLTAGQSSAEAREGGLMLIASMPRALGVRFEVKLGRALSATLEGLADDADSVREAALEAGRSLVSAYAKTSLDHLLPEILAAMREKLWRIRLAATRLLGDMLLVVAGALPDRPDIYGAANGAGNDKELESSDGEDGDEKEGGEDEDGEVGDEGDHDDFDSPEQAAAAMTTEAAMKAIEEVLGIDRRNEVLAALYIIRCDVSIRVRQMGMQVWKTVVANTPRVLREIMPSCVQQIVEGLSDEDEERRAAAGKTLGDLSQKLGDRVVPEVLPALRVGIITKDGSERVRRGACEGLGELVLASPKQQLEEHSHDLIDTVYQGLCAEFSSVRAIAAEVFAALLKPLGAVAVDAVVPLLIQRLSSSEEGSEEDAEIALDALKQILRASGARLMTIIVPSLVKERPLSAAAARALAAAAIVAESSFEPHVVDVADAVVDSMESLRNSDSKETLEDVLAALGTCGEQSVKVLLDEIISKFNEGYVDRRVAASMTLAAFCRKGGAEVVSDSAEVLLEVLIRQLADVDESAARAAWEALKDLSAAVPSRALSVHIPIIRQSIRSASTGISVTDATAQVLGLQLPRAPAPFVPILTDGLLNGEAELREQAALGIAELVELTNVKSLGPFVIKLTGPLIRVMSDRFPWQVKAAVLKAILASLKKAPALLRTFAPQLQSIFVKGLNDNNRVVRKRACACLGALVPIQARLEGLLNDLVALGQNAGFAGSRTAAFHSCSQVFRFGKKLPESAFTTIPSRLAEGLSDEDGDVRGAASRAFGLLAGRVSSCSQYTALLDLLIGRLQDESQEYTERVSSLRAIGATYLSGKDVEGLQLDHIAKSVAEVAAFFESVVPALQSAACATGADYIELLSQAIGGRENCETNKRDMLLKLAERAEFDSRADVRVSALNALKGIIRLEPMALTVCAPGLVVCAADTNTGVQSAADRVFRRAFLSGRELSIDHENLQLAKDVLDEEDQKFIDRRIPKLRSLSESDDENE